MGEITDERRIRTSISAIRIALDRDAAVIVTSRLSQLTEGAIKPEGSLAPIAQRMSQLLGREVPLVANSVEGVSVAPDNLEGSGNHRLEWAAWRFRVRPVWPPYRNRGAGDRRIQRIFYRRRR